ncbi:DUF2577 domain-containing protein [Brevibacillus borstelensis]
MLGLIKKAAMDATSASNPVGVFYGTILSAAPLNVEVDQRFVLTEEFLELTESTKELKVPVEGGGYYTLRRKLEQGDRVILLRVQGGTKYIILDRVRDE